MRFALFGDGREGRAVAQAVAAHPGHQLTHQVDRRPLLSGTSVVNPGVRSCTTWEELLSDPAVDAVIVAERGAEGEQAVRQLVQAGKAVLVPPALVQAPSLFYELALLEGEHPGRIFPLLGLRGHPLVVKFRELIAGNVLGRLRHAQLDRRIAADSHRPAPTFSADDLARALLCDADLLRSLCGAYDQVTASRSGDPEHGFSLATVTLAGSDVPQAVWTAGATSGLSEWRLMVAGESGMAMLEGDPDRAAFRLTIGLHDQSPVAEEIVDEAGDWLLTAFTASRISPASIARSEEGPNGPGLPALPVGLSASTAAGRKPPIEEMPSLWSELARAVELVDAVERSVRRRRTIDVYFETPSERGIFKTQMTAVGCSLLMLTLGAVVIYLATAATVELPPILKKLLVALIFVPLGVFLALQVLFFVARPATRARR